MRLARRSGILRRRLFATARSARSSVSAGDQRWNRWAATSQPGVSRMQVPRTWRLGPDDGACVVLAEGLFPPEVMERAAALLPALRFDLDADSVDNQPTFEIQWM